MKAETGAEFRGLRVLVADDSDPMRRSICRIMRDRGDEVTERTCGQDALEVVQEEDFDLIMLDVYLGDLRGIDCIYALRQLEYRPKIIMMTSERYDDEVFEASTKADGLVYKPATQEDVLRTVDTVMRGGKSIQAH